MSPEAALTAARWRKRCAVQGVRDALNELRVANRLLAVAEGRPEPRRLFENEGCPDAHVPVASRVAEGPAAVSVAPAAGPERAG